ncbi:MAG: PfkB family carbohydrate kinase [Candidatus Aminicenantia bacterium]
MSLLVVGSLVLDTIKTPFGIKEEILGGSASYFSISSSFFSPVRVVGVVGSDFPISFLEIFNEKGIDIEGLEIKDGKTFRWHGSYGKNPNRRKSLKTELNVFASFSPKLPHSYRDSSYVFLANIQPDLQKRVIEQVSSPIIVAMDTMNHWIKGAPEKVKSLLKEVDAFFLNDEEAYLLTKRRNTFEACERILDMGPKYVILKKGEHGVIVFSKEEIFCLPAYPVKFVKDPTGAGDSFAGAFMGFISREGKTDWETIKKATVWGTIIASFTVEEFGLENLLNLKIEKLEERFEKFKKIVSF